MSKMVVLGKYKNRHVVLKFIARYPHIYFLPSKQSFWVDPLERRFHQISTAGDYEFETDEGFKIKLSELGDFFEKIKILSSI